MKATKRQSIEEISRRQAARTINSILHTGDAHVPVVDALIDSGALPDSITNPDDRDAIVDKGLDLFSEFLSKSGIIERAIEHACKTLTGSGDDSPRTQAIRSVFLSPRPWIPLEEFAAACGTTGEAILATLDPDEGYRVSSGGKVEVAHFELLRVFDAVGHGAIEDALGEDAAAAMVADRMTETVTIRLPKFAIRWLASEGADVALEAEKNLADDAYFAMGRSAPGFTVTNFEDAFEGGQS